MSRELKSKTKRAIQYYAGIIAFFIFLFGTQAMHRAGVPHLSGIFSAFQYGSCLVLVRTNNRKGVITSIALLSLSAIGILITILRTNETNAISGLSNQLFYIITIAWLGAIFAKQDKMATTDSLTGLLNRRGLHRMLRNLTEEEKPFYLIDIGLGNFTLLNDSLGHIHTDKLLI